MFYPLQNVIGDGGLDTRVVRLVKRLFNRARISTRVRSGRNTIIVVVVVD